MAAADSSRFGDPRSGYAQHPPPPPPSLPHPYAHHHHQHQSVVPSAAAAAAAVPAGIPQQSPAYPPPPQQQQQPPQHSIPPHHHQSHPAYGQQQPHPLPTTSAPTANQQPGHLDGAVPAGGAAVPNGRFLPGPAEAPMDSGGGGPSLVHPSYGGMQPHQHQQHQQHHPQHPHHQQFYGQPQHPTQHHHHPQHPHHHPSSGMGHAAAMGDVASGPGGMPPGGGPPHSQQMAPLLPPPALAGGAGVYVPAPPPVTFPVEPQLDFTQILRLFNMTITASQLTTTPDGTNDNDPSSRGKKLANLPPSTWNSMLQSALDGLRSLDPMLAEKYLAAAREIQVPEVAEVVVGPDVAGSAGVNGEHHAGVNGNGAVDGGAGYDEEGPDGKKRRQDDKGSEPQECLTCHAKSSPEWRRGPFGPRTLCNACGLVYIKIMKRRAKGLPDEEDENGEGGDGDDGSESDG